MDHTFRLACVYGLADLLGATEDFDEALALYERVVTGCIRAIGPGHPTIVC